MLPVGQAYTPFVLDNWTAMLLPYPVRLRLTLSEASRYPIDLKFLQASEDSLLVFDFYLSAAWDFATLVQNLTTLGKEKIFRDITSSLEIRFPLYSSSSEGGNLLALCYIRFQRKSRGAGSLHVSYNAPSLQVRSQ